MTNPVDFDARHQALDISRSFIVKAPAGSGKTTLLVKRYLKLLSVVNHPEEIIAITFTRKAANELVGRVINALQPEQPAKEGEYVDKELYEVARIAKARDEQQGWRLKSNPSRIRIQTIDSLCNHLVRQMPWSAGFGAAPSTVSDDVSELYLLAARQALIRALSSEKYKTSAQNLLAALDNDFVRACELIKAMLARRDQWQGLISDHFGEDARQILETNWLNVAEHILKTCVQEISIADQCELVGLGRYAASKLIESEIESNICQLETLSEFPHAELRNIPVWRALCSLLLTADLKMRKSANVNNGFPPVTKGGEAGKKEQFIGLLERLKKNGLEASLAQVAALPAMAYSENEWQLLESLMELLKLANVHLLDAFQQQAHCDHIEIASRANLALGQSHYPSELALRLDYGIKHLLVDEFQDTSQTQMQLFKLLTAGWQEDDSRTVFFVGDPMQSIYRFRQADVGLFMNIFNNGFENVSIIGLTLRTNFRSHKPIVNWVNQAFKKIFVENDDMQSGAVGYVYFDAYKLDVPQDARQVTHIVRREDEAGDICRLISSIEDKSPNASIALLVRGRSHLTDIVAALQNASVDYQGIKIEQLKNQSCIQDVLALTRALLHPGDKLSWLAVLRAPWCGLSLPDLTLISQHAKNKTVWQVISSSQDYLSKSTSARIDRLVTALNSVIDKVGKQPLHHIVARAWHALCGPDTLRLGEHANVKTYFNLLGEIQQSGNLSDLKLLENAIEDLWAATGNNDCNVQLMTMHSAKGLEFDVVILPGLGRQPRPDPSKLLIWKEFVTPELDSALLVSPIKQKDDETRYKFIRTLEKTSQREEIKRLLYVACTRARSQLHLFAEQKNTKKDGSQNNKGSTLQSLLEPISNLLTDEMSVNSLPKDAAYERRKLTYYRLPLDHQSTCYNASLGVSVDDSKDTLVDYDWAGVSARHEGTLMHEIICQMATGNFQNANDSSKRWHNQLLGLGVDSAGAKKSINKINSTISNMLNDPKAQWILDIKHQETRNEWSLTGVLNGRLENIIIDRTFIDEHGVRWIIDYKTSTHEGGNVEVFLDSECERYHAQLEKYAAILRLSELTPINLGLYFPLLRGWREWNYAG